MTRRAMKKWSKTLWPICGANGRMAIPKIDCTRRGMEKWSKTHPPFHWAYDGLSGTSKRRYFFNKKRWMLSHYNRCMRPKNARMIDLLDWYAERLWNFLVDVKEKLCEW